MASDLKQIQNAEASQLSEEYASSETEEFKLAQQLKEICNENGEEKEPAKSVPIFHKLGKLYQLRKDERKLFLVKSAALFNAAIIRCNSADAQKAQIENDLKILCTHILDNAEAKCKNADLVEKADFVKEEVARMRSKVTEKLKLISQIPENTTGFSLLALEQDKVKHIRELQVSITQEYTSIMADVARYCEKVMGPKPCLYALVGLGSLARREITPYSDFEHVIVLENINDSYPAIEYFKRFSIIFYVIIINVQETIIPSVMIDSLNGSSAIFKNGFYDSVTTRGISFDGLMPHASKQPIGRVVLTKNKPWKTELIKPVNEMLQYLNSAENIKNGYHLGDILTTICFVSGDASVFEEFQSGLQSIVTEQRAENLTPLKTQVAEDLQNFATIFSIKENPREINVKKDIYRSTTLFISALGRFYNITAPSSFDIIDNLENSSRLINQKTAQKLRYAVAIACEIRLKWYQKKERQCDIIKTESENFDIFFNIVGKPSTISYFQTAYALQSEVAIQFKIKKLDSFYSHPLLLLINLCLMFKEKVQLQFLLNFLRSRPYRPNESYYKHPFKRLYSFRECLQIFNEIALVENTDKIYLLSEESTEKLAQNFYMLALQLSSFGLYAEAMKFFKKCADFWDEIERNIPQANEKLFVNHKGCVSLKSSFHKNVCADLWGGDVFETQEKNTSFSVLSRDDRVSAHKFDYWLDTGRCLFVSSKPEEALQHFKKSLEMQLMLRWSGNKKLAGMYTEINIARVLFEIAQSLLYSEKFSMACNYAEWIIETIEGLPQPTTSLESSVLSNGFFVLGASLIGMGKHALGRKHLEQALALSRNLRKSCISGPSAYSVFKPISDYKREAYIVKEISKSYVRQKDVTYAITNCPETLKCIDDWNLDYSDKRFGLDLHEIGKLLLEERKFIDAQKYFKASCDILKKLSKDPDTDPDVAAVCQDMGNCCFAMKDFLGALNFFNSCLHIRTQISVSESPALRIIDADNHFKLGICCIHADQIPRALACLNKFQQIMTKLSRNTTQHIIDFYRILSRYCLQVERYEDGNKHLETMLKLVRDISCMIDADCEFASIYSDLGWCCYKSKDLSKAKKFFEEALGFQMKHVHSETDLLVYKSTFSSLEITEKLAGVLELMSLCWIKLNRHCEAIECLDRYLIVRNNGLLLITLD